MAQIPKKPVAAPEVEPRDEGFPKYRLDSYTDWDTKETTFSITIIGFDCDYAQIELGPGPFGIDGYATEAEARAGAAKRLRELADRIERGE